MAKDKKDKKDSKAKGSGNKTTSILLVLVALAIALAGANTWLLLDTRDIALKASAGVAGESMQEQASADPVFVTIDPFTVNLASDQFGPRLLYLGMTLEVDDGYTRETLMNNLTQARSRLLVLLSGKEADRISNSEGKRELAEEIKAELMRPYGNNGRELVIHDVLFTEFIVQ